MGCTTSSALKNDPKKGEMSVSAFLSENEKRIVRESWDIVALDLPATGLIIFTRLFELEKDFKKLFRRLMTQNESGEYIFDSVRLERHATMVMKTIGEAVANLDDSSYFSEMLILLGERHINYQVKPEMLQFLWPAIRDSLKMRLGEKFGNDEELAWKHMFDYMTSHMATGIRRASKGD